MIEEQCYAALHLCELHAEHDCIVDEVSPNAQSPEYCQVPDGCGTVDGVQAC